MHRVVSYIDGFNLYFGLKASGYRRYYWLDVRELARRLLRGDQRLVGTRYFTARIASPPDKQRRQATYLEALDTIGGVDLIFGRYQRNERVCRHCGHVDLVPNEKMTDVNIAVDLLTDAFQDRFDTALLISADGDLSAPIASVRRLFPHKRIVVAFPPGRSSAILAAQASAYLQIGRASLARSMLPPEIPKPDGYVLRCPPSWR